MKSIQYIAWASVCAIFFLAAFGIYSSELNLDLNKVNKTTGRVTADAVIITNPGGRSFNQKVFAFMLNNLDEALGTYRPGEDYTNLIENIRVGDTITVYYNKSPSIKKLNINVYQIEKDGQVLESYKSYEHNHSIAAIFLLIIGFVMLIFGAAIIGFKRYVNRINKKSVPF